MGYNVGSSKKRDGRHELVRILEDPPKAQET